MCIVLSTNSQDLKLSSNKMQFGIEEVKLIWHWPKLTPGFNQNILPCDGLRVEYLFSKLLKAEGPKCKT